MSGALDRLVRESRPELGTREAKNVDWERVDREVFRRVESARRLEAAELSSDRGRGWAVACGALAAAAAVAFVFARKGTGSSDAPPPVPVEIAGTVASVEGGGALLVDGRPVTAGTLLYEGDVVDARGAQATVERTGKLTFVLERGARATVTHVRGALVLALQEGAVEAQVVPVPNGEAFAVDVGSSRVAVHGTHLRVARSGGHVVVDLGEGVVSLGEAPRMGSTLGTLITAPAHVEFTAGESEGTLDVVHDPAAVHLPSMPGSSGALQPAATATGPALEWPKPEATDPAPPATTSTAVHPAAIAGARAAVAVDSNPEASIAAAVRSCLRDRPHGDNVTLVVNTVLHLELGADGAVQSARFDPPVAPDVNACATPAIYRARFGHGGSEAIAVDVTLPSSAP